MRSKHPFELAVLLGFLMLVSVARAAQPRLEITSVTRGAVSLRLLGEAGQVYRIDYSRDLTNWLEVTRGPAVSGVLTVQHSGAPAAPAHFYRGVLSQPAAPYLGVQSDPDTNLAGSVVVTPDLGGLLALQGPEGTRYTLDIPTNAVSAPVLVTMTLVTNLTGVPAADGFLAGVQIEPGELRLSAAAFLEMQFLTNLPSPRISSYAFEPDGSQLHLVPDLVGADRVRIPVTRLGGYGSGIFTLAELQAVAATGPGRRLPRAGPLASMEECYPDDEAEAQRMREDLEEAMRPVQQHIAEVLGEERQRQLLGAVDEQPGDSTVIQAFEEEQQFFEQQLKPRIAAASQKCATARELLPWLLGHERQRQLLGLATDDEPMDPAVSDLMCQGLQRCQEQALECCRTRGGDSRLVSFLLGIERQRQLLGISDGSCGAPLDTEGVINDCVPQWFGELRIVETGRYQTNASNPSWVSETTETWNYVLEAVVDTVKVDEIPPFDFPPIISIPGYTNFAFELSGMAQGSHTVRSHGATPWDGCDLGRVAPSGVRPQDGGGSYLEEVFLSSATTNRVHLQLGVATTDKPGFIARNMLSFLNEMVEVQKRGMVRTVTKTPSGLGCVVETTTAYPDATDKDYYGNYFVNEETGGFEYSWDTISYSSVKTNGMGHMDVTKTVNLRLWRKQ